MEQSSVTKSNYILDSEKDFLTNVDYLKSLVKTLQSKSPSEYDRNLIYETVYADMYVTDLITKSKSPELVLTLNDIRNALELVLASAPSEDVLSAREAQDYTKILKNKYKNIDDGSYVEKKAYAESENIVSAYFRNRLPAFILGSIMMVVILLGLPDKITSLVTSQVTTVAQTDVSYDDELESISESESNLFENMNQNTSTESTFEVMKMFSKALSVIISIICTIVMAITFLTIGFDLLYLTVPFVRYELDSRSESGGTIHFASIEARGLVESFEGGALRYKEIKSFDRIKRNLFWLDSMLDSLRLLDIEPNSSLSLLKKSLEQLSNVLSEQGTDLKKDNRYYMNIAKIEFLHDRYLDLTNSWQNNLKVVNSPLVG